MMPHLAIDRGETTTKSKYNGGYKWFVETAFPIDEAQFEISLLMSECGDKPSVHLHTTYKEPGPSGNYQVSHQYAVNPWNDSDEFSLRV